LAEASEASEGIDRPTEQQLEDAATDDPCALLSKGDLRRVFGRHPIPAPERRILGGAAPGDTR
jgi:hypothetical protein